MMMKKLGQVNVIGRMQNEEGRSRAGINLTSIMLPSCRDFSSDYQGLNRSGGETLCGLHVISVRMYGTWYRGCRGSYLKVDPEEKRHSYGLINTLGIYCEGK